MNRGVLSAALVLICVGGAFALSPEEIVEKAKGRTASLSVSSTSAMLVTARDGSTSERLVEQYGVEVGGLSRSVVVFQKPAGVANTRFLTVENAGRADDRWIFLPALGRTRRVAGSEGSGSFVGTDFSYDDLSMSSRGVDKDAHVLVREEPVGGEACYVIESTPREKGYQYSRVVSWISTSTFVPLRTEMYDKKGTLVKVLDVSRVEVVQGIPTPMSSTMRNVKEGTSTTIEVQSITYGDRIPDSVFTERYLMTGRP